jgi:hypothetical protein
MRYTLALAALALALTGCDKTTDAPAEKPKVATKKAGPSRAPVQKARLVGKAGQPTSMPAGHGQPTSLPAGHAPAGGMPAGHPPAGGMPAGHPPAGGMPTGHPPAGGAAPAAASGVLAGTVELASGLEAKVKPGSVMFISVRRDAGPGQKGMFLAAKRIVVGPKTFPVSYIITGKDVMMQGTALTGAVRIDARIDQDGDAISKQPGDVVGALATPAQVGAKNVTFTLDKTL